MENLTISFNPCIRITVLDISGIYSRIYDEVIIPVINIKAQLNFTEKYQDRRKYIYVKTLYT